MINLAVPNNLAFTDPVHCRVLLTDTVEATTVGNTILISKGLLDSLPNEESIASVISMELAHIALGHHIDTRYAFNDRLMFPDESTFQRIDMNHTDADNASAAKKAMEYLQASMYKDKLASAGLYWAQLADRGKVLKALNTPKLGDSLLKADGTPWMATWHTGAQDQLGRPGADSCAAAGKLAEDRSVGRQGAHAERQAIRAHECARQDAAGSDTDLLQAAAL